MPETNHVSRVHSVAAVAWLQFTARVMLLTKLNVSYFHIGTFSSRCAVASVAALLWFLYVLLCFRGVLIRCIFYE